MSQQDRARACAWRRSLPDPSGTGARIEPFQSPRRDPHNAAAKCQKHLPVATEVRACLRSSSRCKRRSLPSLCSRSKAMKYASPHPAQRGLRPSVSRPGTSRVPRTQRSHSHFERSLAVTITQARERAEAVVLRFEQPGRLSKGLGRMRRPSGWNREKDAIRISLATLVANKQRALPRLDESRKRNPDCRQHPGRTSSKAQERIDGSSANPERNP